MKERHLGYILILPAFVVLLGLIGYPFSYAVYLSFTDKFVGKVPHFVGFSNYTYLLRQSLYYLSVKNSLIYTVFAVGGKVLIGTAMALLLNQSLRARGILRGIFLLPWVIPTFITAYTWQWLYDDMGGLINLLLKMSGLFTHRISWLSDPHVAMFSVILVNVWRGFPFIGITLLAGMQGIPASQYEAASVDGANVLQKFFFITLPSLKNIYIVSTLLTTIWTLNDFELVYILTRGGPMNRTKLFSILSFEYAFESYNLGIGTTVSIIFAPIMLVLMLYSIRYIYQERNS